MTSILILLNYLLLGIFCFIVGFISFLFVGSVIAIVIKKVDNNNHSYSNVLLMHLESILNIFFVIVVIVFVLVYI